jgi:hypothetical protein
MQNVPLPHESVQMRTVGKSGVQALAEAEAFADFVKSHRRPEGARILDFGVGWGRRDCQESCV